jgi:threonine dehydratase
MQIVARVPLAAIRTARERLDPVILRSPVVPCPAAPDGKRVSLKLENLQQIGSFKVRPVGNAVLSRPAAELAAGIYTSSSGNSGLAVAWMARRLGVNATVVVPDSIPEAKWVRLEAFGARVVKVTFEDWWRAVEARGVPGQEGLYIDAVRDPQALAGDGTAALEILEQLPDVEAVLVPFGGGGLACGTACAIRALRPDVQVIACELETAQPFTAALRAGKVVTTPCDPGFVTGVGFSSILPEMWPLARELIDATITVSLAEVAAAIKVLAEHNKVIAEGAGAIPVAAALSGRYAQKRVCAIVSGGNLGNDMLTTILAGGIPGSSASRK